MIIYAGSKARIWLLETEVRRQAEATAILLKKIQNDQAKKN
jgi:hypothetical protein